MLHALDHSLKRLLEEGLGLPSDGSQVTITFATPDRNFEVSPWLTDKT